MFSASTKAEVSSPPTSPARNTVLLPYTDMPGGAVTTPVRVQPVASIVVQGETPSSSWLADTVSRQQAGSGTEKNRNSGDFSQTQPTTFSSMFYLGRCLVDQPTSQLECEDAMSQLIGAEPLIADIVMPCESNCAIHIVDDKTGEDLANFPMRTVISLVRSTNSRTLNFVGLCVNERLPAGSETGASQSLVFYCHVLKADSRDQVSALVAAMDGVIHKQSLQPYPLISVRDIPVDVSATQRPIEVAFDVREPSVGGHLIPVPRSCCGGEFAFQRGVKKEIQVLVVQPESLAPIIPNRCVGVAIAAGSNVAQSAMNLLGPGEIDQLENTWRSFLVRVPWEPTDDQDGQLNKITEDGPGMCMSIAADISFGDVKDPLRFMREINVKVSQRHDKLVRSIVMPPMFDLHCVCLNQVTVPGSVDSTGAATETFLEPLNIPYKYKVNKIDLHINHRAGTSPTSTRSHLLSLVEAVSGRPTDRVAQPVGDNSRLHEVARAAAVDHGTPAMHRLFGGTGQTKDEQDQTDGVSPTSEDEVLLSGAGPRDRNWSDAERSEWDVVFDRVDTEDVTDILKNLKALVSKHGIPEALRGIVWPVLCGCRGENDNAYFQGLLEQESEDERVISNDVHRTFTGHAFFSKADAAGQAAIFSVSKAYSNHDKEVGYCQGLSFIVAMLVLHMSTECAFRVLVCIMYKYHLRDLFAVGLSGLKLRLYQLSKFVEDQMPDLHTHFNRQGINISMFATQWFLSLFTSSFGLYASARFLDLFLLEGIESVFQMALALLKLNRKSLLQLEFDAILEFFRHMPKQYLAVEQVNTLFDTVQTIKVSSRKVLKYKKEYEVHTLYESYEQQQLERLQNTCEKAQALNRKLTKENQTLADELVKSKIEMRAEMDDLERRLDLVSKKLRQVEKEKSELQRQRDALQADVEKSILSGSVSSQGSSSGHIAHGSSVDSVSMLDS